MRKINNISELKSLDTYSSYNIMPKNLLILNYLNLVYKHNYLIKKNKFKDIEISNLVYEIENLKESIKNKNELINNKKNKKNNNNWKDKKTYIIKDLNTGLYKIGCSINVVKREYTLMSQNPNIKTIKIFNKNIENKLHNLYSEYKIRGEWFKLNKIQINYICTKFN